MDDQLVELAEAHGVATWYEGSERRRVDVSADVVVSVLGKLGVDAATPEAVRTALAQVSRDELPPTIVLREGETKGLPDAGKDSFTASNEGKASFPASGRATIRTEDGRTLDIGQEIPGDLPLGWHTLIAGDREITLVVVPKSLPEPPRTWGWMLQLYSMHSRDSWGSGDLADLKDFVTWSKDTGAGVVLLNPMHAVAPVHPIQPSPYSPSSRRHTNPVYLRVTATKEYLEADDATKAAVDALKPDEEQELIDYDRLWDAKIAALELIKPQEHRQGDDFAVYCALAEQHGADYREWPAELRHPDGPAVLEQADPARISFHAWLQELCDQQLVQARQAAEGMAVGIVHDLPVGVDPGGADAWALQDVLAPGVTVGAPPDAFNQQGQNWSLPPWHPRKLAEAGYKPYRDLLQAVFRHSQGLRIDHIAGLWRLWWIPGGDARKGTYVRYDADAMTGILALEAHRAGAAVIGEDLGTVEPVVTETLHANNMLSSAVLWFERDDTGAMLPQASWPERAAASISTHDLPTAAGFLRSEHVRVRAELKVLAGDVEAEYANAAKERRELRELLGIDESAAEEDVIVAMHAFLAGTPCRLVLASPYDVIGETRQPNLPGTVDEYPNWRIPFPTPLASFMADPRVSRAVSTMSGR
ncbi:4-alpha-glucanotransferase [Kutzneria sp. 744]|uniref:4-alpha-glucanotransferase n=1 Tax=Kutzneria sp. (strain 744) TaxID=345341 RepID=UPI0003EEDC23|nr:4-alpha-glucanotransferase [Kutzneria sp. 744]EWM17882.1 4-alpha-glucanotransferase [Kutzneria sp. 744]